MVEAHLANTREPAERVRGLLEFYNVTVHRPDLSPLNLDSAKALVDIQQNLETCLEELATTWGLNWFRMNGLTMPGQINPFPAP
jgi:hypothetical protein